MTRAQRGTLAGCAVGIAGGWNIGNVGAIAAELARAYDVTLVVVGLFTTALFLTHTAVQIPGGKACDRFGAVRVASVGVLTISLGDLIALLAPHPALAIGARGLMGLGTGLCFVAGISLVREAGGSPFAQGLFGGIALAAGGVALAVVPQLAGGPGGWRMPFLTSLSLAVAALALLLALRPRAVHPASLMPPGHRSTGVLRDPRLWRLASLFATSYGLSVVLGNWVIELLDRHSAMGYSTAAVVGASTLVLGAVTRPLGGWILRRHPRRARPAIAWSLVAGASGTVALMLADSAWMAAAGGVLVGIGAGIPFAPSLAAAALARPEAPAASMGFVNTVGNAIVLLGVPLLGLSFSIAGAGRAGFAVAALLWLAALLALPSDRALGVEAVPATRPA
ncbi:MAG: MFS transporter [Solirubrobacteraceae bacterium]|nr:MFS transporter [Solirubrobacteraceae bacterium]